MSLDYVLYNYERYLSSSWVVSEIASEISDNVDDIIERLVSKKTRCEDFSEEDEKTLQQALFLRDVYFKSKKPEIKEKSTNKTIN